MVSHCKYKISNIPVIYEDDWLLIVDKPAGLLTIPTPRKEARTLTSILNAEFKKRGMSFNLYPCHRLDRETSGLIIYAKGESTQRRMAGLFKKRQIKKSYIAFVHGIIKQNEGLINRPIEGLFAITKFHVLERRNNFSILKVMPVTGRTNQIRIHFKSIGHPLVGETKFAFRKDFKLKAKRVCLQAQSLDFIHPLTHSNIKVNIQLAEDLRNFLEAHSY